MYSNTQIDITAEDTILRFTTLFNKRLDLTTKHKVLSYVAVKERNETMSEKITVYEMDTLKNRDMILEGLWRDFEDVPMNPETECMEEEFLGFPKGTHREEIWRYFDDRHSRGVGWLMYRDATKWKPKMLEAAYRRELCEECMSETCVFNPEGICMFPMVYGRKPRIDEDGCKDWIFSEFEQKERSDRD